ncbi:hypothetical protein EDB92DRAFT_1822322 [Lactarius akahatsu]|uniref:Uncharacterized protein n=1 Tax=Lactarius akahatsu TaxID=416441 RepID=A0AAD4Q4Q1_9AGAM|nr:hypothetical protein EDB92DRAFT_1822322 [Lactarius akahatsu]
MSTPPDACGNGKDWCRKDLGLWLGFPLIIQYYIQEDKDDLIAALGHPDCVHRIELDIANSEVVKAVTVMEVPFLLLTHLELAGYKDRQLKDMLYLSNRFLSGFASCLQHLSLVDVGLLDLPKLLLSACDLIYLQLKNIQVPPWGHILLEEIL